MIGPFDNPPFNLFRISPIGVATRKFSGKKRLIIDLSAPHNSPFPSINSLIPLNDFAEIPRHRSGYRHDQNRRSGCCLQNELHSFSMPHFALCGFAGSGNIIRSAFNSDAKAA